MVENGSAVRRSRRAASLTAQVLWNIQIEDDNNNIVAKSGKKCLPKEECDDIIQTPNVRSRKRSILEENTSDSTNLTEFYGKKKKIAPGCSGHIFPIVKPLQAQKESAPKKLTASVAPLIQSKPYSKTVNSPSTTPSNHVNPILLLPVSLQANQGPGIGSHPGDVGGLSLVTLQAPSDLLNCFGLNKSITDSSGTEKQWHTSALQMPSTPAVMDRFHSRIQNPVFPKLVENCSQYTSTYDQPQDEPLNLKMGETSVPSSFKTNVVNPKVALVQPINSSRFNTQKSDTFISKTEVKFSTNVPEEKKRKSSSKQSAAKPQRRKSRASPVNLETALQPITLTIPKKRQSKCPSPDYVCSSPDVDDVNRPPRHTCRRNQIKLRHKAAPAPGSHEYEMFVEAQRRLLAKAKREQKAKLKAKAKLQEKRSSLKRDLVAGNEPLPTGASEIPKSPEERNNGWRWTGKPYTSLVFSVDHGKYVSRQCYPGMCRSDKRVGSVDYVMVRDSVFLLAAGEEELSYIARVTALWEKPNTKEMMVSLVWYYRPEHTDDASKTVDVSEDELYASRHQDEISVACVEERCFVQTYSQFCRTQAKARRNRMWVKDDLRRIVPSNSSETFQRPMLPRETPMNCQDMFFCRYLYDCYQHKIKTKLPSPSPLSH